MAVNPGAIMAGAAEVTAEEVVAAVVGAVGDVASNRGTTVRSGSNPTNHSNRTRRDRGLSWCLIPDSGLERIMNI